MIFTIKKFLTTQWRMLTSQRVKQNNITDMDYDIHLTEIIQALLHIIGKFDFKLLPNKQIKQEQLNSLHIKQLWRVFCPL